MLSTTFFRKLLLLGFFLLLLSVGGYAAAQDAPACPTEVACPEIILSPGNLIGDFFIGDQAVAGGTNRAVLQVPAGQAVTVTIRNIQSPGEAGFNELFVYQETTVNVNLGGGQTRQYTASPRREFIRGTLSHTCDVRNVAAGEDVRCSVVIDGVGRGEFAPGQAADFILDPGARLVQVQLVGGSAGLWEPTFREQTANITAGRTTNLRTSFDKRARLILSLNQAGVVGDFYVNGELIASQVPTAERFVAPNAALTVEVRNVTDPAANGDYRWGDASSSVTLRPNQERTVQFRLNREFLRGTLSHTCQVRNLQAGEDVSCQIIIDGADRGVVPNGQAVTYSVDPGTRTVRVQLVGGSVDLYNPTVIEQTTNITAGRTTNLRTSFDRRARLIVNLNQPGVVADFYVNGQLIGGQTGQIELFVTAGERQNIEIQNIFDPAAGRAYFWTASGSNATVGAGQERTVTIRLTRNSTRREETLDLLQRNLDSTRASIDGISPFWYELRDVGFSLCRRNPRTASAPSVRQEILDANPDIRAIYDLLVQAADQANTAISLWRQECASGQEFVDDNAFFSALGATDGAYGALNNAQGQIDGARG